MKEIVTSKDICQAARDRLLIQLAQKGDIPAQEKVNRIAGFVGFALAIACLICGNVLAFCGMQNYSFLSLTLTNSGLFLMVLAVILMAARSKSLRLYQIIRCLVAELEKEETAKGRVAKSGSYQ